MKKILSVVFTVFTFIDSLLDEDIRIRGRFQTYVGLFSAIVIFTTACLMVK